MHNELRMQLNMRRKVDEYISQGFKISRGPLTLKYGDTVIGDVGGRLGILRATVEPKEITQEKALTPVKQGIPGWVIL